MPYFRLLNDILLPIIQYFIMQIDEKLISRLENLAKLQLSEKERQKIKGDLNNILEMVEKLKELDTENIDPLVYINEEVNILRNDKVNHQVSQAEALKNAPKKSDSHFKVPKVIDIQ